MKTRQVSEFKDTEIGRIPKEWCVKSVKEISDKLVVGFVGTCAPYYCKKDEGFPMIRTTNLTDEGLDLSNLKYITEDFHKKNKKSQLEFGDILIARHGSNGLPCYFDKSFDAQALNVIIFHSNSEICNPKFLFFAMKSPYFLHQIQANSTGTVQDVLNTTSLSQLKISLPSLDEQNIIVNILERLEQKIIILKQQNEILEQIIQTIFKSWFIDFDGIIEFDDSEIGKIPRGWTIIKMSEIIEINPSRNLKKSDVAPYLGMTDIPPYSSRISKFRLREFSTGMKFMNGDTLVARITPSLENGKTAFVDFLQNDEIGWGSTEYIVLRPRSPFPPEYGYCFARTEEFRNHAIVNMTGTSGRQRVPEDCFEDYKIINPPIEIVKTFETISKKIFLKIKENAEMRDSLIILREILLPKLMSGEIRV